MLRKLIKHEFRATRRIMLPMIAAILLLSLMAGFSTRVLNDPGSPDIANIIGVFVLMAYFAAMFAAGVAALVLMIERFEKNLLGTEGYLMMTLPVSVDKHILAKLIVSVVWFACAALIGLSLGLMMLAADGDSFVFFFVGLSSLGEALSRGFEAWGVSAAAGSAHVAGYVIEAVLLAVMFTASVCLRFYLAMAIGYSFNNHKRFMSVIAFFAIAAVLELLSLAVTALAGEYLPWVFEFWIESNISFFYIHIAMLALTAYCLVHCIIFYIPTRYFLKNRLNLA